MLRPLPYCMEMVVKYEVLCTRKYSWAYHRRLTYDLHRKLTLSLAFSRLVIIFFLKLSTATASSPERYSIDSERFRHTRGYTNHIQGSLTDS